MPWTDSESRHDGGSLVRGPLRCSGDTERFGAYRERVEALLTAQRGMWKREPGAWTVIPLDREPQLFALVAADSEGERRGREVIAAFVGPAVGRLADSPWRCRRPPQRTWS